ncbi:MAG: DUF507 family protein [Deltaproteobacteria bacterium]|nr:DUF507 family protein [Deltaproteobacteria bacterium]
MKLAKEQIDKVSRLILDDLKDKKLIVLKAGERRVLERMSEAILTDLRAEDDLDREVERMLEAHSGAIASGKVDYKRMFTMIKTKLAKERGIVL